MVACIDLKFAAREAKGAVRREDLIIVVDVLRCSTSIINALANGANAVIPVATLEEAYRLHSEHPRYLLAGERKGCKPKGFDLGNSPLDFTPEQVFGKDLIMTTTSGTVALTRSGEAKWVLVGAFLNAKSIAKKAVQIAETDGTGVSIVLSGEKGRFSLEDFMCAGAIAERFPESGTCRSDKVLAALLAFKQSKSNLFGNILRAQHAKHLVDLGFRRDVEFSCKLDVLNTVPVYREGKITKLE